MFAYFHFEIDAEGVCEVGFWTVLSGVSDGEALERVCLVGGCGLERQQLWIVAWVFEGMMAC